MFNPHFDRVIKMVETMSNKHIGEMNYLKLNWETIEYYDSRNPGEVIQQIVPVLDIDFK